MDSVYDNLENYDDANALEELKRENQELRLQLEENNIAMQKLQKCIFQEFDILGTRFKQMQLNYSSLLKTAREEIKRKTDHINNLNLDKDAMVLRSLQNGNMRWNLRRQGMLSRNKSMNREVANKNSKLKKDEVVGPKTERHDNCSPKDGPAVVSSSNTSSSSSAVNTHTNPPISTETQYKRNDKPKVPLLDTPKPRSIKDRRKSMPVLESVYDKNHYEAPEKRHLDRFIDKHSYRKSETSSLDERHYNDHEMRESFRGNPGRHYEADKYRGRDKYNDVPHRHKFHHNPEKSQRRPDSYMEDYHKPEQRHRVQLSPPPDTSTRYQRRNNDYRFNYDRYPNDTEKPRYQEQDRNAVKHKITDYEEPQSKRQKTDDCAKPVSNVDKTRADFNDKWMKEAISEPNFRRSPLESGEIVDTCQSPDIRHIEAVSHHAIREIKHTAAVKLQDPRLVSNKYILKTESGNTLLTTTASRYMRIKPVDKSLWNSKTVEVPNALKKNPFLLSEDFIKDIYTDLDNPTSYLSPETDFIDNDRASDNYVHDKHAPQSNRTKNETSIQNVLPEKMQQIDVIENEKPISNSKTVIEPVQHTNTKENKTCQIDNKTCKIDVEIKSVKHKHVDKTTKNALKSNIKTQCSQDKIVTNSEETNCEKSVKDKKIVSESNQDKKAIPTEKADVKKNAKNKHTTKQSRQTTKPNNTNKANTVVDVACSKTDIDPSTVSNIKPSNASLPIIASDSTDISKHYKEKDNSHVNTKNIDVGDRKTFSSSKLSDKLETSALCKSNIALVEGDLELSDENSDFVDTNSKLSTEIPKSKHKTKSSSKNNTKSSEKSNSLSNENTSEIKNGKKKKVKDSDSNQKHKSNKKKSKHKEHDSKDAADDTVKDLLKIDKKLKMKMESKETRLKIGEIFGDSSLITPEDLGLPTCGPPLDDTQDAVDLDIRNSKKLEPNTVVNKETPDENNADINTKPDCNLIENQEILDNSSNVNTTLTDLANVIRHSEIVNDLPPNIVYENLDSEDKTNEKDVVVIISRGVQPQFISENNNEIVNRHLQIEPVPTQHVASIIEAKQFDSNALATSTPHKEYTESKVDETAFSNDTGLKSAVENNTVTSNLQDDTPDVRIFVKRRRKVIKKSPKT